jgi:hypothetical protein
MRQQPLSLSVPGILPISLDDLEGYMRTFIVRHGLMPLRATAETANTVAKSVQ